MKKANCRATKAKGQSAIGNLGWHKDNGAYCTSVRAKCRFIYLSKVEGTEMVEVPPSESRSNGKR